jgi:hypothetical protein
VAAPAPATRAVPLVDRRGGPDVGLGRDRRTAAERRDLDAMAIGAEPEAVVGAAHRPVDHAAGAQRRPAVGAAIDEGDDGAVDAGDRPVVAEQPDAGDRTLGDVIRVTDGVPARRERGGCTLSSSGAMWPTHLVPVTTVDDHRCHGVSAA